MKRIRTLHLPSTAISFMLVVVCTATVNVVKGTEANGYDIFILEYLFYLIGVQFIDYLLGKVNFRSYTAFMVTEGVIDYCLLLIAAYFGKWFGFHLENMIYTAVIYLGVFLFLHYHFRKLFQEEADKINEMLEKRSGKLE